jgi:hypothetical protein
MAKADYKGVTPETEAALKDCIKAVAEEMHLESATYLYAILAGKESDPFARFKRLFRAVCRKNREGARGFLAKLNTIFSEENPRQVEPRPYDVTVTFNDMMNVARLREEGLRSAEELDAAKQRHVEAVARFEASRNGHGMTRVDRERESRMTG